jgi:hypothetical protein
MPSGGEPAIERSTDRPNTRAPAATQIRAMITANAFGILPDETIVSILSLQLPEDIISVSRASSRQLRRIAIDDVIWLPICFNTINSVPYSSSQPISPDYFRTHAPKFGQAGHAPIDSPVAFYYFYLRYFSRHKELYGTFLPSSRPTRWLYVISLNFDLESPNPNGLGPIQVHGRAVEPKAQPPPSLSTRARLMSIGWLLPDRETNVDELQVEMEPDLDLHLEVTYSMKLVPSTGDRFPIPPPFQVDTPPPEETTSSLGLKSIARLEHWRQSTLDLRWSMAAANTLFSFEGAPFPSLYMAPALRNADFCGPGQPLITSGLELSWKESSSLQLVPLRYVAPTSHSQFIQTGYYAAPYSSHGIELLFVHIRALTDLDFQVMWPWEGSMAEGAAGDAEDLQIDPSRHLGPFSTIFSSGSASPSRIQQRNIRSGSRILEVIKLTGDENVPRGQRSIVAFLDDPLVSPEQLQNSRIQLPQFRSSHDPTVPWPISSEVNGSNLVQDKFSPSRGIDIPGRARVAGTRFTRPQWTECVVHVDSLSSFSVWWEEFDSVSSFLRLDEM